ncbi:hypothetical protein HZS_4110 [Henneguya salminicola]|uniref:G2/mitotic-specific cyclin-B (Trinotate prediction) n=1 Tax=Henneguya salminicola TaxID=69463 RepID=A0A6G3MFH5_HENSL|nr:hypothetical protein HZS_4110 [Henneguya salminicola]
MVHFCANAYTKHQIIEMEAHILEDLDYDLSPPIALQFLRRLTKMCAIDQTCHAMAKYFMETSLTDSNLSKYSPALNAAACVYLAMTVLKDKDNVWKIEEYSNYKFDELIPFMKNIPNVIKKNIELNFGAVHTKFTARNIGSVSCRQELKSEEFINFTYFSC